MYFFKLFTQDQMEKHIINIIIIFNSMELCALTQSFTNASIVKRVVPRFCKTIRLRFIFIEIKFILLVRYGVVYVVMSQILLDSRYKRSGDLWY